MEEAAAYQQLLAEFGLTHEDIASRVGKSRSAVTNTIRLLQLPARIQAMVGRGQLSAGHARALLGPRGCSLCRPHCRACGGRGMVGASGRGCGQDTSQQSRRPRKQQYQPPRPAAIIELEDRLGERLGTAVKIAHGKRGGKVSIKYSSLDDLERIYRLLELTRPVSLRHASPWRIDPGCPGRSRLSLWHRHRGEPPPPQGLGCSSGSEWRDPPIGRIETLCDAAGQLLAGAGSAHRRRKEVDRLFSRGDGAHGNDQIDAETIGPESPHPLRRGGVDAAGQNHSGAVGLDDRRRAGPRAPTLPRLRLSSRQNGSI